MELLHAEGAAWERSYHLHVNEKGERIGEANRKSKEIKSVGTTIDA